MSRFARALLSLSLILLLVPGAFAQSPEENDAAAEAAAKNDDLPLITSRSLDFVTDEGTWISLDLSPDGETIVFELLGDLYTLPVAGGEATRITSGQGYDMQPRYSPDGTELVFVSDRSGSENLWIADADGSHARALTDEERENFMSPVWAPDGEYIVATKGTDLYMFHVDGGSGVQLSGAGEERAPAHMGAAFAPDPRYLWVNVRGNVADGFDVESYEPWERDFAAGHVPRSSARLVDPYQLGMLDRDNGRVQIRTHELEGAYRPVPSPDGRWVVYATRYDARSALKRLDLETGEDRWLLMDVQRDESQGGGSRDRDVYMGSAFTPDSTALITSFDGRIWRVEVPSGTVTPIPFRAHVQQELGALAKFEYPIDDDSLTVSQIRGARPSPDGTRVVFSALDRLWIANLPAAPAPDLGADEVAVEAVAAGEVAQMEEGSEGDPGVEQAAAPPEPAIPVIRDARRLTDSNDVEHAPVWSPDGRHVAYVTWNDVDGGAIYRVPADGSGAPERLTPGFAFYDKVSYSRDGSRLVAVRGSKMHRMRTLEDFGGHGGAAELEYVWLPADGGEPTSIAWVGSGATQQGRNAPHVGPDPDRIYVWAGRAGLLSMRYDGTDVRTIVKVSAPGRGPFSPTPEEVVISPDGKRALVRVNRNVYMITVPPVGGEAPTVSVATRSSVPTWRLTDIGGDFVGWSADGRTAHYSIGRSFFRHDLDHAEAVADAQEAEARAREAAEAAEAAESDAEAMSGEENADGDDGGAVDEAEEPAADDAEAGTADDAQEEDEPDDEDDDGIADYEAHRVDVEIVVPKDKPTGTVALRGARLITMNGDEIIPRGDIVVVNNRIAAIGPQGEVTIPAEAEVFDMTGRTIYPGLVDIHAHTWVAWGVHRAQVSQFLAQLAYGVTTQRDPQTSSEDVVSYSDLMETGELIGPRIYSTGPGVFSSDIIESLDDARDVLRRYSDHFNTLTIKQYMAGDRKVRQWIIMAANELGLTPTTEGGSNFTMNLTLMQDGYAGLEHSLPISPLFRDVLELGATSGLVYTPTFIVAYGGPSGRQYYLTHTELDESDKLRRFTPHDELDKWQQTTWYRDDQYVHPLHAQQVTKWIEAGGKAGLGSHGEVQGLGTHWELWMMASGGLDPHTALRMATLDSADAIGLAGDIGSLEVGKLADLQILDADPLVDLHNTTAITHVMKNGRLYEADTLNEVWPRRRELPEQWWWRLEPPAPGER